MLTADEIEQLSKSDDPRTLKLLADYLANPLWSFTPRPDQPALLDQQSSFITDQFDGLAVALGGTGSGKSVSGAVKTARYLMDTPPPRPNTPFWVVGKTYDMACSVCWGEKLCNLIPKENLNYYQWFAQGKNWPYSVSLKPHRNGNNWVLEFKSSEADREKFQAASIGGCWIDEYCPTAIVVEIWARMRDYGTKGNFFYTITPLRFDRELEDAFNNQEKHPSWKWYRLNSECNSYLSRGAFNAMLSNEIEELRETRKTGAFVHLFGAVYKNFNPPVHVIDPFPIPDHWYRIRGIDTGLDHPTVCLWIAKDPGTGAYYVYDEYYQAGSYIQDHLRAINSRTWDYARADRFGPTYIDPQNAQMVHEMNRGYAELGIKGIPTVNADKRDIRVGINTVDKLLRPGSDGKPKLFIFRKCENTIREMRIYQWHPQLDKPLGKDNDTCLVAGTMIETDHGPRPIETINPGDQVLTRQGYRTVTDAALTARGAEVLTINLSNGASLTGTAPHPVWTVENGFKNLGDLMRSDTLLTAWKPKLSFSKATSFTVTPIHLGDNTGSITLDTLTESVPGCIGKSGKLPTATYPLNTISTTRTGTVLTMTSAISNVCPVPIISVCMEGNESRTSNTLPESVRLRKTGTHRTKGGRFTPKSERTRGKTNPSTRKLALSAARHLKRTSPQERPFVPTNANPRNGETKRKTTSNGNAGLAASCSKPTDSTMWLLAPVHVVSSGRGITADVYNLTVDQAHEYFANGILVSNCDALRYALHSEVADSVLPWQATLKIPERNGVSVLGH